MPHDRNGEEVKPGDRVLVECVVKAVHATEEFCNVDLETVSVMPPSEAPTRLTLNTKQVKLRAEGRVMFRAGGDGDEFEALRAILGAVIAQASTGARAAGEIKAVLRMVGPRSFGRLVDAERDGIAWPFIVAEYRTRCGCFADDWRCELSSPGRFCVSAPMLNGLAFVQWVDIGAAEARAS